MERRKMTREEICEFLVKARIEHEPTKFENISFMHQDLSEIAFMDCDFINCRFHQCELTDANFTGSTFYETQFSFCDMTETNFDRCHFASFFFDLCYVNNTIFCYSTLKNGGFMDCRITECDMTQTYQFNVSYTRGYIGDSQFPYSTLIDVAYYQVEQNFNMYNDIDCHHITMDNPTLREIYLKPFGDEITIYGGYDNNNPPEPVETYKEFAVHLLVNTKGEAQVTLAEEV